MKITDWPAAERPREKLMRLGPAALSEAELLAIWLRAGRRGRNAVELARSLLTEFGSLRGLFGADCRRLCRCAGVGPARYAELQAALELTRRQQLEALYAGPALTSPRLASDYLLAQLRDRDHEVFCCLFLDNRHRLIAFEELFKGTIDGASVHPREVIKLLLEKEAAGAIAYHNHPSGVKDQSHADEIITRKLVDAFAAVDARLIDHVICAGPHILSFAQQGLL